MTYVTKNAERGWQAHTIDLDRLALDLAKELGGTVVRNENDADHRRRILIGQDIIFIAGDSHKGKINAYINAADVKYEERDTYTASHKTPDIHFNPDARTIAKVAADLRKRLIDPAQEPLRLQREYAQKQRATKAGASELAKTFKARYPDMDVRCKPEDTSVQVYSGGSGHYLAARLYPGDGGVSIDRIGSVSLEQFQKIVDILNGKV